MTIGSRSNDVWSIREAVRRMGDDFYEKHRDACHHAGVMVNATAGISFQELYNNPAAEVLGRVLANVARPAMGNEDLLGREGKQRCLIALERILGTLSAMPSPPRLYDLCTHPSDYPELLPLFTALDRNTSPICVPFVREGYDPSFAKESLDKLLDLLGPEYTYADLYNREPASAMKLEFNRVMVRAKRAGFLVELIAIRKPAASCYVSDPDDARWDVRSCVSPENAVLFNEVHQKINTMAYLMAGLNYGDFFDLPIVNEKVLPHFRARIEADQNYWFSALEKERILAALDAIVAHVKAASASSDISFRDIYGDPGTPPEVLIQFQRIRDVKPEICLPFMCHDFDHAAAADAIDVFLRRNGNRSLKQLYTTPPEETTMDVESRLALRNATSTLLGKSNDQTCLEPGNCIWEPKDWCSTMPVTGNCYIY